MEQGDETNGDPHTPGKMPIIGGRSNKESWTYFVCRFFSRTMRWNSNWRSWLSAEKHDTAMCARALMSRFWSKLSVGEFIFDRFDWLWEWYDGKREKLFKRKKSAAYALINEMKRHKHMLAEDLLVMRVNQMWVHGPIGHSVSKGDATAKEHVLRLRAFVTQAEVMAGEDEAGTDERNAVFGKYIPQAFAQRYELQERSERPWNATTTDGSSDEGASSEKHRQRDFVRQQQRRHDATVASFSPGGSRFDASKHEATEFQHERLRLYAKATASKHRQFLGNLLQHDDETEDIIEELPDMLHTFHVR